MTTPSLAGRTVVVTRAEPEGGPLGCALTSLGARALYRPLLSVRAVSSEHDIRALQSTLAQLAEAHWLVLTSPRALEPLQRFGLFDAPAPAGLRVAVVGQRTAAAVHELGWQVDLVPESADAEGLLAAMTAQGIGPGTRVIFPASARARRVLPDGLRALGVTVEQVTAYHPVELPVNETQWHDAVAADALTFSSPSAVDALTAALNDDLLAHLRTLPAGVQGPTTGAAARSAGWQKVIEADPRSFEGLALSLATALGPNA
jgi:uroporphyrinogen-III synthase